MKFCLNLNKESYDLRMRENYYAQVCVKLYNFYCLITHDAHLFWQECHFEFKLSRKLFNSLIVRFSHVIMAEYFHHLHQLLVLSWESFEDELHRLVSSPRSKNEHSLIEIG